MPAPHETYIQSYLDMGYKLIIFNTLYSEPPYLVDPKFISNHTIVYSNPKLFVISENDTCVEPKEWEYSYQKFLEQKWIK